jgi:hypothetical protein
MTTIAFDGKTLATDSQDTGSYKEYVNKILVINNTVIVGTGSVDGIVAITDWLVDKTKDYPKVEDATVFVFSNINNIITIQQYDSRPTPNTRGLSKGGFFAAGSGGDFALGAMLNGATAKQAVKIACKLDASSSGPVNVYKFK